MTHVPAPFVLTVEEQDAVRHILREVERRGYDDVRLDPVVQTLYARLGQAFDARGRDRLAARLARRPEP
jgi:hypothetical protein